MIRRPPRSTPLYSSAASDVYKRQVAVMGTLQGPLRHLGLDHPRVDPQPALVQPPQHLGGRLDDGGSQLLRGERPPGHQPGGLSPLSSWLPPSSRRPPSCSGG